MIANLHYGDPETSTFSRVSPYIYAALGVVIVVLVGTPVSYLFPYKQSVKEEKAAYACTYAGLNVEFDWRTFAKNECHPTTDRLLEEIKADMSMAHPSY
uniref:Col_cuticle_N domain-containing protein n=1 Tax=Steinernema glaseri TaxID=37863 RepID=A0A1I7ZSR9_9BILA